VLRVNVSVFPKDIKINVIITQKIASKIKNILKADFGVFNGKNNR